MKYFYIRFLSIIFLEIFVINVFSQTATTTVLFSGFQSCGGCTVCGADYWCTNTPGSYCGDTPPCQTKTFFDPVPAGNTVTSVTINYYTASCEGASFVSTISGFATPTAYDGSSGCLCDDLPCMMTTSVTASYPCGVPGYVYGGNNTFQLCSSGPMCINRAELVFSYYPTPSVIPTITASGPLSFCAGGSVTLTANSGFSAYLWNTGSTSQSITVSSPGTYTVTVTGASGCTTNSASVTVTNSPGITPTFNALGPFCVGASPPALPTTSTNGLTGTWSPSTINTGSSGTTTYTFTPSAGQCGLNTTMNITVNPNITPTFAAVGPYCQGATIPALPTTSTNGITGTWSPAINNNATTTYTFTPTAGQCATSTTLTINITPGVTPTFNAVGPYCSGATIPALPTTSTTGITGTWSPAINNSATTTYTFTPNAGQCAAQTTLTISITPQTTPTFSSVGPYCVGATIPALPNTSNNGITGTWSPAINNSTTTTYTFTPTAGLCASNTSLTININNNITPTFTQLGPYCVGATPGVLPSTSNNGISGTWSPAVVNTSTQGSTTYTFTPTSGLCATATTMTITVNSNINPTFTTLGPYCVGATPAALPTTSNNGITGTWSPSTINTSVLGSSIYTFTPTAGQCATSTTMTVVINNNTAPTFTQLGPYCIGATPGTLPTTSNNGISGIWNPATISTSTTGSTTYTFTPNAGQCAASTVMTVVINSGPTINAGADTAVGSCAYSNYLMNPTTASTIITWSWTPSTGLSSTNTQNPTAHPTTTTTYVVTATDNNGCTGSDNIVIYVRPLPTSNAGPDVSIGLCPSSDTTLIGTGTGAGPLSYSWSPSTGLTTVPPSGQNAIAKPNATTTYTLTVTDRFGCTAADNVIVTVNPLPTSEAGSNVNIGACSTSTANLSGSGTGTGPLTYSWTPTTGISSPNNQNTVAKPPTTTTYQLTVRDIYGCTSTDNVTVTVNLFSVEAGPNADIGACSTSTTVLSGVPTGVGPFTNILWSPSNGLSSTNIASPITAHPSQTTTYTLSMTDAYGCSASDNVTVTVHPLPLVNAGYNDSIGTCPSSSTVLNGVATGSSPFIYSWLPVTGLSNTSIPNPVAKPNVTTVYVLTVTDSYSCSATDNVTITVKPLPTVYAGNDTTIGNCNTSIALLVGSGTGTAPLNYLWSPTTGLQSASSPITNAKPSSATTYVLTITDMFGCTATDNVTVDISNFTVDAGPDIPIGTCSGSVAQLNAITTGMGPFTYNWSPASGLNQSNIPNPVAQPGSTTIYSVVATDFFGCSATDAMIVSVNVFDETVLHFTMEPDRGCEPLTTNFGFTPNNQIIPNSWVWDFGDDTSPDDTSCLQNTSFTYLTEGNYIATLTVTSIYGCTVSYSDTVFVSRKPIADFRNVPGTGSSDNPRIEFFDQSFYANHWSWNFGDPSTHQDNIANTKDAVHVFSDSGLFKVILIVSNNEGCSDTAEKYINIYQSFAFFIPNAFTPNEDDVNEVFLPQGVGCRTKGYLMLIYDRWGKQLFKNEDLYKGWDGLRPNGDPYSQGVYTYIITVFEDAGKRHTFKGIVTIVSPDHNH